jgi:type I restriction enzyme S subunit
MSDSPFGWSSVPILEILQTQLDGKLVHQGWSPQCESSPATDPDDWAALKTTAIQDGKFLPKHNKRLPKSLDPRPRLEVKVGDLLLTCAGPRVRCGVACLVRETKPNLMISGKMYRFRALETAIDPRFLEAFLRTPETKAKIDDMKTGMSESGMNITHEKFSQLVVALAPLKEQKRITEKLDFLLSRVAGCRERLNRLPALIKRFKQAVLAAATSGALTSDLRDLNSLPWIQCCFGSLLLGKPRNGYSPRGVDYETPVKSLTLSATTSGRFDARQFKFIDEQIDDKSHLWLKPGDLLIQRANSIDYVGVSAVFDGPPNTFIYPDLMMKCQPNALTNTEFLHIAISSEASRTYMRENATGTAGNMPKINQQVLMSVPIALPPKDEQAEIVRRVTTLFDHADRLEFSVSAAISCSDRLPGALLTKALRGELVPQDPNDEPVQKMLERLRTVKSGEPLKATPRGRKRTATA